MASIYTHQDSNVRKTWILMSLFFIIIIGVGWAFSYIYNAPEILFIAVFFSIFKNIFLNFVCGGREGIREVGGIRNK